MAAKKPSRRYKDEIQVPDTGMEYLATKLHQHLEDTIEYVNVGGPESTSATRTMETDGDVTGGVKLFSHSTKYVVVETDRTPPSEKESGQKRALALNWIKNVKKGKFKKERTNDVELPFQKETVKETRLESDKTEIVSSDSDDSSDDDGDDHQRFQSVAVTVVDGKIEAFKPG